MTVRTDKIADRINSTLDREIRAPFRERRIKHTIFTNELVINTNNALTNVEHYLLLSPRSYPGHFTRFGTDYIHRAGAVKPPMATSAMRAESSRAKTGYLKRDNSYYFRYAGNQFRRGSD